MIRIHTAHHRRLLLIPSTPIAGLVVLFLFNGLSALANDVPQFIGLASCATATCHGGVIGTGPSWHTSASVWQSSDPHAMAGEVLFNELSRQIVVALDTRAGDDRQVYLQVLKRQCADCHAPAGSRSGQEDSSDPLKMRGQIASGVSCEACHGPASLWEKPHVRIDWNQADRFGPSYGMLDTETLLARTDTCASCHVGSRSGGVIRDMNHDMIAAGHPALHFDMYRHFLRYSKTVRHWEKSREPLINLPATKLSKTVEGLQARVLLAASRLSLERRQSGAIAPELSEFDCAACHHSLRLNSLRQRRTFRGVPSWQPWYVSDRLSSQWREQLRWSQPALHQTIKQLAASCARHSEECVNSADVEPLAFLEGLLSRSLPDNRFDYLGGPGWIDQVEIALVATASRLPDTSRQQMTEHLRQFRSRKLGFRRNIPDTLERLMPSPWDIRDLESCRMELKSRIAAENIRGSQ